MREPFILNDDLRPLSIKAELVPMTQTVSWDLNLYTVERIDFDEGRIYFKRIEKE